MFYVHVAVFLLVLEVLVSVKGVSKPVNERVLSLSYRLESSDESYCRLTLCGTNAARFSL